ncbi:hypothetical protein [Streptacidiphilus sp. EB129]|uniref:hypothetical protein n=1 Tax=Streptacidiphilus sp. EB129 TaxID=3156262 RepID=UPI0035120603
MNRNGTVGKGNVGNGTGGDGTRGDGAALRWTCSARWPEPGDGDQPPPLPGFVESTFSPMVAAAAERCLRQAVGPPPVAPERGERIAVVLVSVGGDVGTADATAAAVDAGRSVPPLLFFQSVPNSVVGHVASRWGLAGPVLCVSPVGDPQDDGRELAQLLVEDGEADEVLVILAEQARGPGGRSHATAVLARSWDAGEDSGPQCSNHECSNHE